MATRSDSEKIKLIRILKKRAKSSGSNLYKILSRKDELYEKAIRAQRNAGLMTLTCGIVGFWALVIYTIISNINAGINVNIASYIIIAAIYLGIIIPISTKTASLTTTPTVMLVLTIIQLLFTLLLFSGIIPLIAVVYNIIALARWSTYRNWYDEVSVGFYKGEESIQKKEKSQKVVKPKDVYDFSVDEECDVDNGQKKPIGLIVSLVFAIILGIGGCIGCFYWGRNGGWIDGYTTGHNDGLEEGRNQGYELGKQDEETYNKAYQAGKYDMYRFMHSWYSSHGILP